MNPNLRHPALSHYKLPYPAKLSSIRSKAMTLIVGIKYKDGVILAADSQISYGYSNQRTDTQKIRKGSQGKGKVVKKCSRNRT